MIYFVFYQYLQYGLYSSFLGGFLYAIFGSVKEISIGPTSLMALLTVEFTKGKNVDFVILLTFLTGCIEMIMGMLDLGEFFFLLAQLILQKYEIRNQN